MKLLAFILLTSVWMGCTITPNSVITIHDTIRIPQPIIVHDTIKIKSKPLRVNDNQSVNINGDNNGEIIQRN